MSHGTQPLQPEGVAPGNDPLIGQKVGEYVIEAAIAAGGMGIVYRAVHPLLVRPVAIKVVRPEMVGDPEQAGRFLKEAQALSAIAHPSVISVHSFGHLPDGRQYMVMEFLEGESLEAVMGREGAMSPARALPLIDEILLGLAAAHRAGVVHRDLKPSNVFISLATSGERKVKVLDFGLAKHAPVALVGTEGDVSTKSSLMAGTPEYISPEQARGLAATAQTDLYSLGVMLFEMIAGEMPFTAPSLVELMKKHAFSVPPRLSSRVSGIPESLDALVAVLLEKDPEKRPSSADVARQTVTRILRELREQSTRQAPNPLLAAPAVVIPSASVRSATTDRVERVGETDRALEAALGKSSWRTPIAAAIGVLLLLLLLVWWLGPSRPLEVVEPPTVVDAPKIDIVKPAVAIEPAVKAAAEEKPDEELTMLDPNEPKRVHPTRLTVKSVEQSKRWIVMGPGCTPDAAWRDDAMRTLRELGELSAKDKQKYQQWARKEAAVSNAINSATGQVDCGQAASQLAQLINEVFKP